MAGLIPVARAGDRGPILIRWWRLRETGRRSNWAVGLPVGSGARICQAAGLGGSPSLAVSGGQGLQPDGQSLSDPRVCAWVPRRPAPTNKKGRLGEEAALRQGFYGGWGYSLEGCAPAARRMPSVTMPTFSTPAPLAASMTATMSPYRSAPAPAMNIVLSLRSS